MNLDDTRPGHPGSSVIIQTVKLQKDGNGVCPLDDRKVKIGQIFFDGRKSGALPLLIPSPRGGT